MERIPSTVEEHVILKAIREECAWENLPKRIQVILTSKEEWHRKVVEHCSKKRLQWNSCFAHKVCKESEYYEGMINYLRHNLALFPYHLAEHICRVMRVSPFRYYCDMIFEVMKNEKSYDTIPNFSAADALRLTGIGRNEFIDIMNKCRSKKIMWKLNKSIGKEFLPVEPVDFAIESWWEISLVNFTLEEFQKLSEEEMTTIDKICKEEANAFFMFDPDIIKGLYRRGLVYFNVHVYPDDHFKVSKLKGFISNREQSYEDPIEELLYAVFVVSSENATVADLATTLQADLSQLQAAASFACRLGWAVKLIDPVSVCSDTSIPGSPKNIPCDDDDDFTSAMPSSNMARNEAVQESDGSISKHSAPHLSFVRAALIIDATITSYLMMGSISPGLKHHAVTLYEAGKLCHTSIADLCKDLRTLEGKKFEGGLQEFANHAFSLRCVLESLQSARVATGVGVDEICAKISSLVTKDEANSGDSLYGPAMPNYVPVMKTNESTNSLLSDDESDGRCHVDVLRCESLAALAPATLDRLFLRDYDIVVSMIPLPDSAVFPGPEGPIHFGPPSHLFPTPWMKLVLYSTMARGPVSIVLVKGQRLRLLPPPLAGCEKALLWSWDGSTMGGMGGKFELEGRLVKGSMLLNLLNSILKHSAVMLQPLSRHDLDQSGRTRTVDVPLPVSDSDGSIPCLVGELGLGEDDSLMLNSLIPNLTSKMKLSTVGFLRLLKLFNSHDGGEMHRWVPLSVEFGMPLFSPKLCGDICRRVAAAKLFQLDSISDHCELMRQLRKKLRDVCAEHKATGAAVQLLYQRKGRRRELMNYVGGRWSPLVDPSSPVMASSQSEHQALKIAGPQHRSNEVVRFDGFMLRLYSLPLPHEDDEVGTNIEIPPQYSVEDDDGSDDEYGSKEIVLPCVNLFFDGSQLHLLDIGVCLQARLPVSLVAEAAAKAATAATAAIAATAASRANK